MILFPFNVLPFQHVKFPLSLFAVELPNIVSVLKATASALCMWNDPELIRMLEDVWHF